MRRFFVLLAVAFLGCGLERSLEVGEAVSGLHAPPGGCIERSFRTQCRVRYSIYNFDDLVIRPGQDEAANGCDRVAPQATFPVHAL